ncbi:MAG: AAA family ATPase [Candidatus Kapabacteria bacterium]|nr:AAA family ATPase [Candidatus Kapabacteria bacterium]
MQALLDFANHGILPFVGREHEFQRLANFCQRRADDAALRAGLLLGEAGSGKSRLFDEVLPNCEAAGVIVVRVKLHPGAANAITPLLAQSLYLLPAIRQLLRAEPEATLPSVITTLQRLARLRPVAIALEDIHLLPQHSVGELATLVGGIADEPITLLCSARPLDLPVRGVLEPHLVVEMELSGIPQQALLQLWNGLFGSNPDPALLAQLQQRTIGNPLAVRSALRGALRADPAPDLPSSTVQLRFDLSGFQASLERNVKLLSEGMIAHLSPNERQFAGQLALLGEVFAHESAELLLQDSDSIITSLMFKGVIAPASFSTTSITGLASRFPLLAFTHTLLHHHLLEEAESTATADTLGQLVAILQQQLPLFAMAAIEYLDRHAGEFDIADDQRSALLHSFISMALRLTGTADWNIGLQIGNVALKLYDASTTLWEDAEYLELRLRVLNLRTTVQVREFRMAELAATIQEYLQATSGELPPHLLNHRLRALALVNSQMPHPNLELGLGAWEEGEKILERAPGLRFNSDYLYFLNGIARFHYYNQIEGVGHIEQRIVDLLDSDDLPATLRQELAQDVAPQLFPLYFTANDIQQRLALLERIKQENFPPTSATFVATLGLLHSAGQYQDFAAMLPNALRTFKDMGHWRNYALAISKSLLAKLMLGHDADQVLKEWEQFIGWLPPNRLGELRGSFQHALGYHTILTGTTAGADALLRRFNLPTISEDHFWAYSHGVLAGDWEAVQQALQKPSHSPFRRLVESLGSNPATVASAIADILEPEVTTYESGFYLFTIGMKLLDLVHRTTGSNLIDGREHEVQTVFRSRLEWYHARGMFRCMAMMIGHIGHHLPEKEQGAWKKRVEELQKQFQQQQQSAADSRRCTLTMLGRVELTMPDGTVQAVRGARMKSILGLLVADRMSRRPLSKQEFYLLAAGEDGKDFELARKTVNMAIASLRKLLGDQAFQRSEETIQLNFDFITVDILEAWKALQEALAAAKRRSLSHARIQLLQALQASAGEVPFPSLYDDYFEAVREDFETRLRGATVDISRMLLREGDAAGAEEILRIGFEWLPDDEEIAELLQQALIADDRRGEAERVKLRLAGEDW